MNQKLKERRSQADQAEGEANAKLESSKIITCFENRKETSVAIVGDKEKGAASQGQGRMEKYVKVQFVRQFISSYKYSLAISTVIARKVWF